MRIAQVTRRVLPGMAGALCVAALFLPPHASPAPEKSECVVLLHGLSRSRWSMKYVEWRLRREGYSVVNVSYPSRRNTVEDLGRCWLPKLIAARVPAGSAIHFVTHSMGGIVVRKYLEETPAVRVGRVVMFAPPNSGCEIIDRLRRLRVPSKLLGPAAAQLGTDAASVPRQLGPPGFELGILAGNRSWNPLFSAWLPGPDDGKVSVASTRLQGMKAHRVMSCSHAWLMWRKGPVDEVLRFLKEGSFSPEPNGRSGTRQPRPDSMAP